MDFEKGLRGTCDFLLSLSPLQLTVQAPVVAIVEAKNNNIKSGLGAMPGGDAGGTDVQRATGQRYPDHVWHCHDGNELEIHAAKR